MMNANPAAASAIERQARVIADRACDHLFAEHEDIRSRFGEAANELWNDHLNERIMELSAALAAGDHRLFSSRLVWSKSAMQARGLTPDDLGSSLKSLRAGVEECLDGELREAALEYIDLATRALKKAPSDKLETMLDAGLACDRLALQYVQTVVAGNVLTGMQLVLDEVAHGMPVADAYLKVLLPAQHEVGRLWHLNELSVSEEHLVSYTTQRLMAVLSTRMPRKPDNGFTAIVGTVSGNVHDIGIRAISYLLEFEGWRTIYLGADIPQAELSATIETFDADVLLLSIALSSQINTTKRSISAIRENCSMPVKILVGGNGLSGQPDLWRELGADGYAQGALEALEKALELVTD